MTGAAMEQINQGDPFVWLARPNALPQGIAIDGTWSCKAGVYGPDGTVEVAAAPVTDKVTHTDGEEYYLVVVTGVQTAALSVGKHILAVDIQNPTVSPPYGDETQVTFDVMKQLIV